jgi:hypothetical protein
MENENDDDLRILQEKRDKYNKNRRDKRLFNNGGIKRKCGRKPILLTDMTDEDKLIFMEKQKHKNIKNLVANSCKILDTYKTHFTFNTYKKICDIKQFIDDNGFRR